MNLSQVLFLLCLWPEITPVCQLSMPHPATSGALIIKFHIISWMEADKMKTRSAPTGCLLLPHIAALFWFVATFSPNTLSCNDLTSCFPHFLLSGPVWDGPVSARRASLLCWRVSAHTRCCGSAVFARLQRTPATFYATIETIRTHDDAACNVLKEEKKRR